MKISIISAVADDNAIGKDNKLLWHISDDLKRFKKLTMNKVVIMGQKTYESLPIKPLPNRVNIVITNDYDVIFKDCIMAYDIEDSISKSKFWNEFNNEIFVIGGGSIYKQFFPIVDYLYITKVHTTFSNADTFFPILNDEWELVHQENYKKKQ